MNLKGMVKMKIRVSVILFPVIKFLLAVGLMSGLYVLLGFGSGLVVRAEEISHASLPQQDEYTYNDKPSFELAASLTRLLKSFNAIRNRHPVNVQDIEDRYLYNLRISRYVNDAGFIFGQRREPQSLLRIGRLGDGGGHGCGPFAAFNALRFLHEASEPIIATERNMSGTALDTASIIRAIEGMGGIHLSGLAGTNPEALASYIRSHGHLVNIAYFPRSLDQQIRESQLSILLYGRWNNFFLHYVMIRYVPGDEGSPGIFLMYNEWGSDVSRLEYSSIDLWFNVGRRGYEYNCDGAIGCKRGFHCFEDFTSDYFKLALLSIPKNAFTP